MKRLAALVLVLPLACADSPTPPALDPVESTPLSMADQWVLDTSSSAVVAMDGFERDAGGFPFHIYWHRGAHVDARIKAAVRKAAAEWGSIVSPTPVLPYVFEYGIGCHYGEMAASYELGDTLAGGFHLYVSTVAPDADWTPLGAAFGPCIGWGEYHPVTGAPPNGFTYLSPDLTNSNNDYIEYVALHEIGHLLGIGMSERWWAGVQTDSVVIRGTAYHFSVQADSFAVDIYEELARLAPFENSVYGYRKIPLAEDTHRGGGNYHWHSCTLSGGIRTIIDGATPKPEVVDVMATSPSGTRREVTPVTASMLIGFDVDWGHFSYWYPEPWWFNECPEQWMRIEAQDGQGSDGEDDAAQPDPMLWLRDDVRPWDYVRTGGR